MPRFLPENGNRLSGDDETFVKKLSCGGENFFAFRHFSSQPARMTQPLALVFYERLMPGSQLVNRLQDLNYRVLAVNNIALLAATAKRELPLLLITDLDARGEVLAAIEKIKTDPATNHLPVIAFAPDEKPELLTAAQKAGANFTVGETALASHLPELLDQAMQVD
jgi:CheY-like chemotaxis protein